MVVVAMFAPSRKPNAHSVSAALRVSPISKFEFSTSHKAKFHEEYSELSTLDDTINEFYREGKLGNLKQIKDHLFNEIQDADVPAEKDSLEEGTEVLVFSDGMWLEGVVVDPTGDTCTFTTFYKSQKPPFKHKEVTRDANFDDIVVTSDAETYLEALVLWSQVNFYIADLLLTKGDKKSAQQHATSALNAFRVSEPFHLQSHPARYLRLLRLNCLCWARVASNTDNEEVAANLRLLVNQFQTELRFHVLKPFEIPHGSSTEVVMEQLKVMNNLFVNYMQQNGEENICQLGWQPS